MSPDEIIDFYVNEKNYSVEAAKAELQNLILSNSSIITRVVTVNATDDLGLTSLIEIGCQVSESHSGGKTNFNEILDSWSGIVSSGIQDWVEFTRRVEIVGSRKTTIDFYTRGTIDVKITNAVSQGFSVELLESFGYSVEESYGTDWIARKVVDLEGSYTLPGYPPR